MRHFYFLHRVYAELVELALASHKRESCSVHLLHRHRSHRKEDERVEEDHDAGLHVGGMEGEDRLIACYTYKEDASSPPLKLI